MFLRFPPVNLLTHCIIESLEPLHLEMSNSMAIHVYFAINLNICAHREIFVHALYKYFSVIALLTFSVLS